MKKKTKAKTTAFKSRPNRVKIDPRFAYLLTLNATELKQLRRHETEQLDGTMKEIASLSLDLASTDKRRARAAQKRFDELDARLFAPLSAGVHFPPSDPREGQWPIKLNQPFASAFILSDASARDLERLGVRVRTQAGDIFSAFVPLSRVKDLEAAAAIRYIELARPLKPTLDDAIPYAQIDTLHSAAPPVRGTGVIVGIIDSPLDFYHPDFRTAAGATRVRFLWDQTLAPQTGEAGPPTAPALPGFTPAGIGGGTYGVEYTQANIDTELTNYNPPGTPAYQTVRHQPPPAPLNASNGHGTVVTGCAAGNGLGQASTFVGAAPNADIIFVAQRGVSGITLFGDSAFAADAFAYIFARAALLGQACVVNMSASDNQGPHDGSTLGEQFLDNLLVTPGRAITLSSGNSTQTNAHTSGNVAAGGTTNLTLNYTAGAANSDDVEIWYDGHDRFDVTVTTPGGTVIGPVTPGNNANAALPGGVSVQVASVLNDPRNGDNLISIIITVPGGQNVPVGNWNIALAGTTVINGSFQGWVDRNNRGLSAWVPADATQLTLGVPSTARRPITVGNHNKTAPTPAIIGSSGRGPTRDGRIKPEIATVGNSLTAPLPRNMNPAAGAQPLYTPGNANGTSFSAPIVAGACALLFECRGAGLSAANIKQILQNTAGTTGLAIPNNTFGFGFLQMANACTTPAPNVDVWLRDDPTDTGVEPFAGSVAWLCPDIEVLDKAGNPVANPTFDPVNRFNNIIRVTVRNRGTQTAHNTEVYFYWADPATNIPYPAAWNTAGIYSGGAPLFPSQTNMIVIPQLAAGGSTSVDFAWAPPAPGSNLHGDDHFCLLVRLENQSDPSQIAGGGWNSIRARNNLGLHNVHVQADVPGDADLSFYVVGTADDDSLLAWSELASVGQFQLKIPVAALPWRDAKLIEKWGERRMPYGCAERDHPLTRHRAELKGDEVQAVTDIVGAEALVLQDGVASIVAGKAGRLFVPTLRVREGVRMPASARVSKFKTEKERRFVHVAQLVGGEIIGGVALEFRGRGRKK